MVLSPGGRSGAQAAARDAAAAAASSARAEAAEAALSELRSKEAIASARAAAAERSLEQAQAARKEAEKAHDDEVRELDADGLAKQKRLRARAKAAEQSLANADADLAAGAEALDAARAESAGLSSALVEAIEQAEAAEARVADLKVRTGVFSCAQAGLGVPCSACVPLELRERGTRRRTRATELPSLQCMPYSSHPHHRFTSSYEASRASRLAAALGIPQAAKRLLAAPG